MRGDVRLWVPDDAEQVGLDSDRQNVRVHQYAPGTTPDGVAAGDLVVTPYGERSLSRATVAKLPPGAIVQALESGIDYLVPILPDGIVLCNARGVHDGPVAEWVLTAILASLKRMAEFHESQREGMWRRVLPDQVSGKVVLILGYGSIAQAVERRLAAFDAHVLRVARTARDGVEPVEALPALLPQADVVVLLTPLTKSTAGMVDAGFLARMRDGALLVNAGRGGLVVTDALLEELTAGRLYGALDVTDPEPLPEGHPLWSAPQVLITPHVASDTPDVTRRLYRFVAEQASRVAAGQPLLNVVSP